VNPTTGKIDAAHFGEFKRTDTLSAVGVKVLGMGATADEDLKISDDDKGKILRLALDAALKKMIPKIDQVLTKKAAEDKKAAAAAAAVAPVAPAAPETPAATPAAPAAPETPAVARKFCAGCGAKLEPGAKFCPGCGEKV